jgi:hypothetical protein
MDRGMGKDQKLDKGNQSSKLMNYGNCRRDLLFMDDIAWFSIWNELMDKPKNVYWFAVIR